MKFWQKSLWVNFLGISWKIQRSLLSFLQFLDFQIGKTRSSQEFSTWDLDNLILIVVYFKGYFSWICTFVHFTEIFNFVQFSQHICQNAEFLSSYHEKKSSIQIFMQKYNFFSLCKIFVNIMYIQQLEVSACIIIDHF